METNIPEESIEYVVDLSNKVKVPLLIEPVSVEKAMKLKKILGGSGEDNKNYTGFRIKKGMTIANHVPEKHTLSMEYMNKMDRWGT